MHRWSQLFIPTLREAPTDAEVASHKLLLRGGYVRQLGAGIYSYLFLGNRSINKIVAIIREEMDRIGQEFLLPALHPRELWEESGRWSGMGENMFRLKDRKGAELCLGMTHEEVMTSIARNELRSYKQLPQIWYQIQTKFRDEPRPKSGLLRVRQFLMKDAYSFDLDEAGLDVSYNKHDETYRRIFLRCGLSFVAVDADSGAMGGSQSQEFMVYTDAGEDLIASSASGYAANIEKATSVLPPVEDLRASGDGAPELVHTPDQRTIEEVGAFLSSQPHHQIKTMAYTVTPPASDEKLVKAVGSTRPVVVFLRGDHQVNEAKLAAIAGGELRPMTPEEIESTFHAPAGYLGPIGVAAAPHPRKPGVLIVLDAALDGRTNLIAGANRADYHLRNVTPGRDFKPTLTADVRNVAEGEPCPVDGSPLRIGKAVEIGHIFKLGYKYSKSMGATVLNQDGKEVTPIMGSYGIGVERILTAAIETSAARNGGEAYALPAAIAPFQVVVTVTNVREANLLEAGERIASNLDAAGFDVLLDDRDERAGVKFKDADLIGIPYRINVGKKLADGLVELVDRLSGQTYDVPLAEVGAKLGDLQRDLKPESSTSIPLPHPDRQRKTVEWKTIVAVKLKYGSSTRARVSSGGPGGRLLRGLLLAFLVCLICGAGVFGYFYYHFQKIVDERLAAGPMFAPVAQIFAAAKEIRTGQRMTVASIAQDLRRAGYNSNPQLGTFQLNGDAITIKPGPESFHSTDSATIHSDGTVQSIVAESGAALRAYELEPQLITALSEDKNRTKRRLVTYQEIPPRMVQAVTSIEDRRFFEHSGVNFARIGKCAFEDIVSHHMQCGGSTLTQQLARGFFLSPDKKITRKLREIMITFQLEARFNKRQIFEMYANQINLGQRGSFAINGFGEAAQAFFGKDLRQLNLSDCALLAGMIQSPSRLNPYRHPDRAMERRNLVLDAMVDTGAIGASEASRAKAEPLRLAPPNVDAQEAPYFVDLVHEQLVQHVSEQELAHDSLRIYTSLDPELQSLASEAVEVGMRNVDNLVRKQHRAKDGNIVYPQVSLVALNPHTGQVLALVGGRNYGASQLNHAVAKRPTGSIFKPFVYAAAYNSSLNGLSLGDDGVFTAVTRLNDDPQDFGTGGQSYTPGNFERGEYPGMVTAATAIEHSLNIATIALAQKVGYENVAALARSAGITTARATASVAIGTYSATPLEMAGAYTVFANNGVHLNPWMLASVRNANGDIVSDFTPEARQVMEPRAAFLTQSLLEGVMARGTGSAVRRLGFNAPAAGKTGTSHDVWFAGYSSNLLCIIWVGNDDYTNLELEGAKAAAPIWAEFMNRAIKLSQYSDMRSFQAPAGITTVRLDRETNLLADTSCPKDYTAAFLDGTAPQNTCSQMSDSPQSLIQKLFGGGAGPSDATPPASTPASPDDAADPTQPTKKRNFLQKLFGGPKKQPQPDTDHPQ